MIRNVKNLAIRLSLLFISIIGIYFCNNVNGYDYYNSCYNIEGYGDFPCIVATPGEYISYDGDYNSVSSNLNFTYQSAIDYKAFSIGIDSYDQRYTLFWNSSNLLDVILDTNNYGNVVRLYGLNYMCRYNGNDYTGAINHCFGGNNYTYTTDSFYQTVVSNNLQIESYLYMPFKYTNHNGSSWYYHGGLLCLKYTNSYYCINLTNDWFGQYSYGALLQEGIAPKGNGLEYYANMFSNSPIRSSGNGGSVNNGDNSLIYTQGNDLDNTISYFENQFGWNVNMCYVGTNNLTGVYGTAGIDFQYGQGDTIFGLFNSVYGGFGDNTIQNVGRFINTWLINYSQWFATSPGNRLYLAKYDGPGYNVTYYYTGLSFPYSGQPVAIYFMSDLLFNEFSSESTQGESMAYYCYLKFNYNELKSGTGSQTFDQVQNMVTPGIVGRVNDYVNVYLSGHVGFLVPDYSGSIWGDVSSGSVFDGDVDPSNTFEDFYNDILGIVNRGNYTGNGILPSWIVFPLLFLILFRILKH